MFKGKLYSKQRESASFLCTKKKALLATEQGLGKTVVALASAEKLRELNEVNRVLIVCPASITWQWEDKIKEFTDASWKIVTAKNKSSREYETDEVYTVISYSLLRKDYVQVARQDWSLVIADEAQEIKNNRSKISRIFKQNLQKVPYKWALTGTAISNKLEELYSILYWVDRDFLPSWPAFEKKHITRNYFGGIKGYKNLELLSTELKRRVNRVEHSELEAELPTVRYQTYYFDKTSELITAEKELLATLDNLVDDLDIRNPHDPDVSRAFHHCRKELFSVDKLDFAESFVAKVLEESEKNKVVIFSFYKKPLELLQAQLEINLSIPVFKFTGDESHDQKQQAIEGFSSSASVLLCSNAGSVGLDLPFANNIVHLDVPFDFATLDQRSKRITRLSSNFKTCVVSYTIIKYSLEEFYFKVVHNKGLLADAAISGNKDTVTVKPQTLRNFLQNAP